MSVNIQNLTSESTNAKVSNFLLDCSNQWAISFAYAMTGNERLSERIVADSIVALISEQYAEIKSKLNQTENVPITQLKYTEISVRLAHYIWEFSKRKAVTGSPSDEFFGLLPITRAVCILKTKAKFNRSQICESLRLTEDLVEYHLTKARLLFTHGRAWIEKSADVISDGNLECPYWNASTLRTITSMEDADIQNLYSQYLGGDLDESTQAAMHAHFTICNICRKNLIKFKEINQEWVDKIPSISLSDQTRNQYKKYIKQMNYYSSDPEPSFWAGIKKVFQDPKTQVIYAVIIILFVILKYNS